MRSCGASTWIFARWKPTLGSKEKGFASSVKGAWKKFVGSISKAYDKTVQTAGETIELNRLYTRRKELDRQNTDLYAKIGMQVYRAAGDQIDRSAFLEQITQIERNYAEQRELLLREARLKAAPPATDAGEEALSEEPLGQALGAVGEADKGALPDSTEPAGKATMDAAEGARTTREETAADAQGESMRAAKEAAGRPALDTVNTTDMQNPSALKD